MTDNMSSSQVGEQRSAPDWIVDEAVLAADDWLETVGQDGGNTHYSSFDIGYLALRIGGVAGLQRMPTSEVGQEKAIEIFEVAASRDPVGAAIAWSVGTDLPLPAKRLEPFGMISPPRVLSDHARSSRHEPTNELLRGNVATVDYSGPVSTAAIEGLRDAVIANAGRFGTRMPIGGEANERARAAADELKPVADSWAPGLALDPYTLDSLARVVGQTQGLEGLDPDDETRIAGRAVWDSFAKLDPKGAALAWAMGTDRTWPRQTLSATGIDEMPRDLSGSHQREEHTRTRLLIAGVEPRERGEAFEQDVEYLRGAFDRRRSSHNAAPKPDLNLAQERYQSWTAANMSVVGAEPKGPMSSDDITALADAIAANAGLKKIPTSDQARDNAVSMLRQAAEEDPIGATIAWTLGTNLPPPRVELAGGQILKAPREVTEFARDHDYSRTRTILSGETPPSDKQPAYVIDAVDGMRRGFAHAADSSPSPEFVVAAIQEADAFKAANVGKWSADRDPKFEDVELSDLRDIIGKSAGLRKHPTSTEGYVAASGAFEAALERDPGGAMIAWAKATDLPMPVDILAKRGIDFVPRELHAWASRAESHERTAALLSNTVPPERTNSNSYIEQAVNQQLRKSVENAGVSDISPERLRSHIQEAKRRGRQDASDVRQSFGASSGHKRDDSGLAIMKDAMSGIRGGMAMLRWVQTRRERRTHEVALKSALGRGKLRVLPVTKLERSASLAAGQTKGPSGLAAEAAIVQSNVTTEIFNSTAARIQLQIPAGMDSGSVLR